jgi:hypothetical protein
MMIDMTDEKNIEANVRDCPFGTINFIGAQAFNPISTGRNRDFVLSIKGTFSETTYPHRSLKREMQTGLDWTGEVRAIRVTWLLSRKKLPGSSKSWRGPNHSLFATIEEFPKNFTF